MIEITPAHVRMLLESQDSDAALVLLADDSVAVRSLRVDRDDCSVIVRKDAIGDIDQSGSIDFTNISDEDAALVAEHLNELAQA